MHQNPFLDPVSAAEEYGAAPPEAADQSPLPPGGGRLVVPHYMTFSQLVNLASRTYRWQFDEALRHNQQNALAIRRDPVVMDALRSRQIPTAQLPWHIDCRDDQDSRQAHAVQVVTEIIESIPNFQRLKMHLLEALWWGRYGVQMTWAWDYSDGSKRMKVADHRPINGDKLHFKYSGQAGVLVHATFPGEWEITDRGRAHFFSPEDRERVIIHKHEPEDADFFEAEMAGQVHGVGIRSRIYWFWWLRSQVSAFLMDYLERVGAGGFTIYYYEAGNPESLKEVKASAEEQHRNNTILFPRYKDGSTGGPGIQRVEPNNSGTSLLQTLISGYFDEVIRRYILGQNLTSQAVGTGMGSGVADLHADTFARLVKYDAVNLGETLTTDLVWVIQKYLFPGLPPLRFVFDVDKPNARDVLESAQAFYQMGGTLDEDEIRSVIGLAKPQPGHSILAKMGNLSPAGMPMGVPMMGQAGPDAMGMGDPMGGIGGPMMMAKKRRKRLPRWGERWLEIMFDEGVHDSPDAQALGRQVLNGDWEAIGPLADALLDAGDPNADAAKRLFDEMGGPRQLAKKRKGSVREVLYRLTASHPNSSQHPDPVPLNGLFNKLRADEIAHRWGQHGWQLTVEPVEEPLEGPPPPQQMSRSGHKHRKMSNNGHLREDAPQQMSQRNRGRRTTFAKAPGPLRRLVQEYIRRYGVPE